MHCIKHIRDPALLFNVKEIYHETRKSVTQFSNSVLLFMKPNHIEVTGHSKDLLNRVIHQTGLCLWEFWGNYIPFTDFSIFPKKFNQDQWICLVAEHKSLISYNICNKPISRKTFWNSHVIQNVFLYVPAGCCILVGYAVLVIKKFVADTVVEYKHKI